MPHVGHRSSGLLNPNGAPRRQTQRLYAHIDRQLCFSGQTACAHTAPRPSAVACTNSHTTHPQSACSTNSSALDRHRHRTQNHPNTNSSCTCCRCCCQLATGSRCVHNWLQHSGITANPTYTHIPHRHCSVLKHSIAQHSMHVAHVLIRSEHTMHTLSVSNSHKHDPQRQGTPTCTHKPHSQQTPGVFWRIACLTRACLAHVLLLRMHPLNMW